MHRLCLLILTACLVAAQTPNALRKHVTYLASDKLTGRGVPSPGLELAVDYVAAEFKKIGLEPAGGDGYFQKFTRELMTPDLASYSFTIQNGSQKIEVLPTEILLFTTYPMSLTDVEVIHVDPENLAWVAALKTDDIKGKIAVTPIVLNDPQKQANSTAAFAKISKLGPALMLMYGPGAAAVSVPGSWVEPGQAPSTQIPRLPIRTDVLRSLMAALPAGPTGMRATFRIGTPIQKTIPLRNVAGILRGTDAALKDEYVVVSANVDGFPLRRVGDDLITNCANTNASGVAAVIETAKALSGKGRAKRSVLFLVTTGEAPDALGARYYREHPIVPFNKTVSSVHLMQLGRSDSSDGPMMKRAAITGFSRSGIPNLFAKAGEALGFTFFEDKARDAEPARGFRPILFDKNVPAHTVYVAYTYEGQRRPADEAGKLDYDNMAKVTQAVVAGVRSVSNTPILK